MKIADLDTPALLIDAQIMHENLTRMQSRPSVACGPEPHTKDTQVP